MTLLIAWLKRLWLKIVTRPVVRSKVRSGQYASNPLMVYPRNVPCWCGSLKKAKRCCLPSVARICTIEQARAVAPYVNMARARRAYDTSI